MTTTRTFSNPADINTQLSSTSGAFNTSSTSYVTIVSVTLASSGNPVRLELVGIPNQNSQIGGSGTGNGWISFFRDSTQLDESTIGAQQYQIGGFAMTDFPAAGSYTYYAKAKVNVGTFGVSVTQCKLRAYEK